MRSIPHGVRTALLMCAWLAAAVATHLPPSRMPKESLVNDKLIHFSVFCVLGMLAAWRFIVERKPPRIRIICCWFLVFAAYAMVDETTQPLVGRTFEWLDLAADTLGALAGLVAATLILPASAVGPDFEGGTADAE